MDHELLDGAACAGSDLTARLFAELSRASDCLALAEARIHAAVASGLPAPERARRELLVCRRHVATLQRILSGMPDFDGGDRAASA